MTSYLLVLGLRNQSKRRRKCTLINNMGIRNAMGNHRSKDLKDILSTVILADFKAKCPESLVYRRPLGPHYGLVLIWWNHYNWLNTNDRFYSTGLWVIKLIQLIAIRKVFKDINKNVSSLTLTYSRQAVPD